MIASTLQLERQAFPSSPVARYVGVANMEARPKGGGDDMSSIYVRGNVWWGKYAKFIGDRDHDLWEWKAVSTKVRTRLDGAEKLAKDFVDDLQVQEEEKRRAIRRGFTTQQQLSVQERGRTA